MPTRGPRIASQQFSSHDGMQISFITHGSPDRRAVFLLHGFQNSAQCWFEKGKRFTSGLALDLEKAGYYVVAPDLRGHGQSAQPVDASKYTEEQELYDVVALADHLGVETFAVVGYSHGAIEAAKLLTIDRRLTCGVLGGIGDKLADKDWNKPKELARELEAKALQAQTRGEGAGASQRSLALAGVQRGQSVTTPAELAGIRVPVLCINGRKDVGDGDRQALSDLIPGSEIAWVSGDHATATMDADFCERIVSFLSASFPARSAAAGEADVIASPHLAEEQVPSHEQASGRPEAKLAGQKTRRWKKVESEDNSQTLQAPPGDHEGRECGKGVNGTGEKSESRVKGRLSMDKICVDHKAQLRCSVMSQEEVAAITVPFEDIEARLSLVMAMHGSAVVTGVATEEECGQLETMFSEDLRELIDGEALKGASDDVRKAAAATKDPRTWPTASMKELGNINRCQLRGLPHGRFAWAARLNPRVRRVYEVLHGKTELVSSCDNSFFAPGSSPEERSNRSWPHVDHNKHDYSVFDEEDGTPISEWEVYQGILYVWPSTDSGSSTTVVWTGSHTDVYEELMSVPSVAGRGRKGNHFTQFPPESSPLVPRWHAAARRVPVPAGALFLWSSRTVHQGWTGGPRLAQPVCWEPRSRRTEAARVRKLRMAALGLPSTHWGSLGLPHNLVKPCLHPKVAAKGEGDDLTLPMVSTLRPVTLADAVQVQEVWQQLGAADWSSPLPAKLMEVLERSIAGQFHAVL